MKIYGENQINKKLECNIKTAVALGNFDGIHYGHRALLETLCKVSKENNLFSVVYTFEKHTEFVVNPNVKHENITNNEEKIKLLEEFPIDSIYFEVFSEEFSKLSCEEFVEIILLEKLSCRYVVVGEDYSFGKGGNGDSKLLEKLCNEKGIQVIIVPSVVILGNVVSSTLLKKVIKKGFFDSFKKYTGREYSVSGIVLHGRKVGRTIGFPTANLVPEDGIVYPDHGVYFTKTLVMGEEHYSVTNVGNNPTFDLDVTTIETHLLDRDIDLYDKNITVVFISKIRGEIKFKFVDELKEQIRKDTNVARIKVKGKM